MLYAASRQEPLRALSTICRSARGDAQAGAWARAKNNAWHIHRDRGDTTPIYASKG